MLLATYLYIYIFIIFRLFYAVRARRSFFSFTSLTILFICFFADFFTIFIPTPNGMSIFMSIYILIYIRNNIYEYLRLILQKFSEVVTLYKIVIYVVYKPSSCQVRLALFFSSFFSGVLRTPFSFFCSFASFGATFSYYSYFVKHVFCRCDLLFFAAPFSSNPLYNSAPPVL